MATMATLWKITSGSGDRWFAYDDDGTWRADPQTTVVVNDTAGAPVLKATMSEIYRPTGPDDPVGLYLHAREAIGAGATITGTPPDIPPPADYGVDVVH